MGLALLNRVDQAEPMTPPKITPETLRAQAVEALRDPGARRLELQRQLDLVDAELKPLIKEAREVEVTLERIRELTGVALNTIRAWTK